MKNLNEDNIAYRMKSDMKSKIYSVKITKSNFRIYNTLWSYSIYTRFYIKSKSNNK